MTYEEQAALQIKHNEELERGLVAVGALLQKSYEIGNNAAARRERESDPEEIRNLDALIADRNAEQRTVRLVLRRLGVSSEIVQDIDISASQRAQYLS
jgi:hypothetical protein